MKRPHDLSFDPINTLNTFSGAEIVDQVALEGPHDSHEAALNYIIQNGKYKGFSLLALAVTTEAGIGKLHENISFIWRETLNHAVPEGRSHKAGSPILALSRSASGIALLDALADLKLIDKEVLNHMFVDEPAKYSFPAFQLAQTAHGLEVLSKLVHLITPEALNYEMPEGTYKDLSLAFVLACTPKGVTILSANNYQLANLVYRETFNRIILSGGNRGRSLAMLVTLRPEGLAFLSQDNYRVAQLIDANTLNYIIPEGGENKGFSLAYMLTRRPESLAILSVLAHLINKQALNHIIPDEGHQGKSLLYRLTLTEAGIRILSQLTHLIDDATLTRVVESDGGLSAEDRLNVTPEGRALLEARKQHVSLASAGLFSGKKGEDDQPNFDKKINLM